MQAYVVEDLAEEAIIGTNFMEGFEIELDLKKGGPGSNGIRRRLGLNSSAKITYK